MMDNNEMNRIVAEKVMGWEQKPFASPHMVEIWVDNRGRNRIGIASYSPATNVAQAFEALQAWTAVDRKIRTWSIESMLCGEDVYPVYLGLSGVITWRGYAETPALAITEALVKAVRDG